MVPRRGVLLVAVLAFLALAAPATAATVQYAGQTSQSQRFEVTITDNVVTRVSFDASLPCEDGSTLNIAPAYDQQVPVAANGEFQLDAESHEGHGIDALIRGIVNDREAEGTAKITARAYSGGDGPSGPACAADITWDAANLAAPAAPPSPSGPTPSTPEPSSPSSPGAPRPRPDAMVSLGAVRFSRGRFHRYYVAVQQMQCVNGATHVSFRVAGRRRRLRCTRTGWTAISGNVRPGRVYAVRMQPVRLRRGRIVRLGRANVVSFRMPRASEPGWAPIGDVRGL